MMNAIRFNDWQGRLTGLYNLHGNTQNITFRECASLLSGVREDGSPVALPTAEVTASLAALLEPGGVVANELRLQEQYVYGHHGTYCVGPNTFSFNLNTNGRDLPGYAFRNIPVNAPPILLALNRDYDPHHPSRYSLRLTRTCKCPRRKRTMSTGDIVRHFGPLPTLEDAPPIFDQILFFMRDPVDAEVLEYVGKRGTVSVPDINECRYFTPIIPPQYVTNVISPITEFIPTTHACSEQDCYTTAVGNIIHTLDNEGADRFLLLDTARAFPPRKG